MAAQLGAAEAIDLTGQDLAGNEGVFADEPNEDAGPLDDYASQLHAFEIDGAHVSLAVDVPVCSLLGTLCISVLVVGT